MQKKRNIIKLNDTYNEADTIKYIKSYMFIKGFAVAKNLKQTLIALAVARHFHDGQYRKDGMPYIVHPLKVCTTLMNYGIQAFANCFFHSPRQKFVFIKITYAKRLTAKILIISFSSNLQHRQCFGQFASFFICSQINTFMNQPDRVFNFR